MPSVRLIDKDQAPLLAQPYYADGEPGPITRSLAHVPELLVATAPFLSAVYGDSALPKRLKELVILRTSVVKQCRYCVQTHTAVAFSLGVTREEINALHRAAPANGVFGDPRERALLRWTDALAGESGPIDGTTATDLAAHFAEAEVVELALLVGATLMLNRYCTALGLLPSAATLDQLAEAKLL